jgi:hypothetical protein
VLLITVTEKGTVENARVMSEVDQTLGQAALDR